MILGLIEEIPIVTFGRFSTSGLCGTRVKDAASQTPIHGLRKLWRNRSGNIGVMAGIAAVPIFMSVGGAVDYLRVAQTKARLQGAADAAAMGAMHARGLSDTQRETLASTMFTTNTQAWPATAGATATVSVVQGSTTLVSTYNMETTILKVVGFNAIPITVTAIATATGKKIELAMMTDITGSMAETRNGQTKIDGLKLAADDLLDILLPDNALNDDARVALVPFANYVNADVYAANVTGLSPSRNHQGNTQYLITCVTERTGPDAYTDAAPGPSKWLGASTQGANNANYDADGGCNRSNSGNGGSSPLPAVMPLTNDKAAIKSVINSYTPQGSTAGHLGTAWAWYMIAPEWSSIFNLAAPPRPYNDPEYMKFVVLMTDGEYNTQYSNTNSKDQALALCTAMKAKGITVFTVGLGFTQSGSDTIARDTLTACASGAGHYFFPYDGDALRTAFTQIGNQVVSWAGKVRLSQ